MAITLQTFASGDTDYIAKLNSNASDVQNAINALQAQAGAAGAGSAIQAGMFIDALFNNADALIGPGSYAITENPTSLTVDPGAMYLGATLTIVQSYLPATLNFVGQTAGTKYITVDTAGITSIQTSAGAGAIYSIAWSGSAFVGDPVKLVPVFYDTAEAEASRSSTALDNTETTLDARIEFGEASIAGAQVAAGEALELATAAMAEVEVLRGEMGLAAVFAIRKVGCTVDSTTGIKGAIQIDFKGTIIGWSVIANAAGSLTVEVDRKASSAPPAAPAIPNTTTDKISASAPITLSSAQSASSATSGVSTWSTTVDHWDVIQFNVASVSTITRATLYLRIQETPPDVAVTTATVASGSVATAPFLVSL